MKKMILEMTENDPDLAARIMSSAQKSTLYKNFSLNNYETAGMNPQNMRYFSAGKSYGNALVDERSYYGISEFFRAMDK